MYVSTEEEGVRDRVSSRGRRKREGNESGKAN
jgi:hypothetical protein